MVGMRYLDGSWWIWGVRMTKQELIEKYKTLSDEIFIKHFKFVARAKVARAKAQIELLKEIIADLEKLD